jgi:hypothetical protein
LRLVLPVNRIKRKAHLSPIRVYKKSFSMTSGRNVMILLLLFLTTPALAERCGMSFFDFGRRICGRELFWEGTYLLMHTRPGERVMRPDFGVNWDGLCFEPITAEKVKVLEADLKKKITDNVGINVVSVRILLKEPDQPSFLIQVTYLIGSGSNDVDVLEIPFNCGQ